MFFGISRDYSVHSWERFHSFGFHIFFHDNWTSYQVFCRFDTCSITFVSFLVWYHTLKYNKQIQHTQGPMTSRLRHEHIKMYAQKSKTFFIPKLYFSLLVIFWHKNGIIVKFVYITGLDVRKTLHVWPLHAVMKLIIFGMCLPCPSTGMQLHMQGCGCMWLGIIGFPLVPAPTEQYSFCMRH